jgi:signal transduction histidine kinase
MQRVNAEAETLRLWRENQRIYLGSKVEIRAVRQRLMPVLERCVLRFKMLADERKIDLQLKWLCRDGLQLNFDPEAIDIVLSNLLHNALKYAFWCTSVSVEAREVGPDGIAVSVEDVGHTVSEDVRFEPITQLDSVRLTSAQGAGLAMAAAIVRAHGGWLSWHSEPFDKVVAPALPTHRVRFTFTLPLGQPSTNS